MLQFFRKIRRQLLSRNRIPQYALYALGEIFLVVIGILIAVQINAWNEERKSIREEASLLLKLSRDIESNRLLIMESIQYDSMSILAIDQMIHTFENDLPFQEYDGSKMAGAISAAPPFLKSSTMETIRAKGVDIIRSDAIREQALNLFDVEYNKLVEMYKVDQNSSNVEDAYLLKHFRRSFEEKGGLFPNDYSFILNDPEILNILARRKMLRGSSIFFKKGAVEKSEQLIREIETYLD